MSTPPKETGVDPATWYSRGGKLASALPASSVTVKVQFVVYST